MKIVSCEDCHNAFNITEVFLDENDCYVCYQCANSGFYTICKICGRYRHEYLDSIKEPCLIKGGTINENN